MLVAAHRSEHAGLYRLYIRRDCAYGVGGAVSGPLRLVMDGGCRKMSLVAPPSRPLRGLLQGLSQTPRHVAHYLTRRKLIPPQI